MVLEAMQYLARPDGFINMSADGNFAGNGNSDGSVGTEIDLTILTTMPLIALRNAEKDKGVSNYRKSFSNRSARITVTHTGSVIISRIYYFTKQKANLK